MLWERSAQTGPNSSLQPSYCRFSEWADELQNQKAFWWYHLISYPHSSHTWKANNITSTFSSWISPLPSPSSFHRAWCKSWPFLICVHHLGNRVLDVLTTQTVRIHNVVSYFTTLTPSRAVCWALSWLNYNCSRKFLRCHILKFTDHGAVVWRIMSNHESEYKEEKWSPTTSPMGPTFPHSSLRVCWRRFTNVYTSPRSCDMPEWGTVLRGD